MKGYTFSDLQIMEEAPRYSEWVYSLIKPFLSGKVLEIGAGTGNISKYIIGEGSNIKSFTCIEPDAECCSRLEEKIRHINNNISIDIHNSDFFNCGLTCEYDTIVLINVLEHFEDDIETLKKIFSLLSPNGRLILFVPAFQALYGSIDKKLNHYRRYDIKDLKNKLYEQCFSIDHIRYYNAIGFFGWWVNNKLFRRKDQSFLQVKIFDNIVLPFQRRIETVVKFPFGQNLYCIARKQKKNQIL